MLIVFRSSYPTTPVCHIRSQAPKNLPWLTIFFMLGGLDAAFCFPEIRGGRILRTYTCSSCLKTQNPVFHQSLETGFLSRLMPFQILLPFWDERRSSIGSCRWMWLTPNLSISQRKFGAAAPRASRFRNAKNMFAGLCPTLHRRTLCVPSVTSMRSYRKPDRKDPAD